MKTLFAFLAFVWTSLSLSAAIQWTAPSTVASGTSYSVVALDPPTSGYTGSGPTTKVYKNGALFASGTPNAGAQTVDNVSVQTSVTYTCTGWSGATSTWIVTITPSGPVNHPPIGAFDVASPSPVTKGSNISMNGWAADQDTGAPVAKVNILVDGVFFAIATQLNGSRPDVSAAFGRSDYQNSGWNYVMSTSTLSTGSHTLSAVAFDAQGASATIGTKNVVVTNGVPSSTITVNKPSGIPLGWKVTITGTSTDAGGDLTSNRVEYLPPGSSNWVAASPNWGDAGGITSWTGTSTTSNTLAFSFTPKLAGTYQFRCQGGDLTSQSSSYATTSLLVAPVSDTSDFDNDGIGDKWEMQYGLDPTNPNDAALDGDGDGYTNLEEYSRWMNPTVSDVPKNTPTDEFVSVILTPLMKGSGTVTITVNGNPSSFTVTNAAGVWGAPTTGDGSQTGLGVWMSTHEENTLQITSTGVSDFTVKASVDTSSLAAFNLKPSFDRKYVDGITMTQLTAQGGVTKLSVAKEKKIPFGVIDTSRLETIGDVMFGLGESRGGQSPGVLVWNSKTFFYNTSTVYLEQGSVPSNILRSHTRMQGSVPAGLFDVIYTHQKITIRYYAPGTYPTVNGMNDFSAAVPIAAYEIQTGTGSVLPGAVCPSNSSLSNLSSTSTLFRRWVGSTPYILEFEENAYRGLRLGYSNVPDPQFGYVESYADVFRNINNIWMWRREDQSVARGGLTTIEYESVQPVMRFGSSGSPNRSYMDIAYWKTKFLGNTNSASIGYYETRTYGSTDFSLLGTPGVSKGTGADRFFAIHSSNWNVFTALGSTILGYKARVDWPRSNAPSEPLYAGVVMHEKLTLGDTYTGVPNNMTGYPAIALNEEHFSRTGFADDPIGSASDLITTSQYAPEPIDSRIEPISVVTTKGSQEVGRKELSYVTSTFSTLPVVTKTKKEYSQSGVYLTSVETYFSRLLSDQDLRGKLVSAISPDNSKVSYAYAKGDISSGVWNSNVSGSSLLWVEVHGKVGAGITKYQGSSGLLNLDIESVLPDDSRSTAIEKIVDGQGRLLVERTLYYKAGNWLNLSALYYGYDPLGNLVYKGEQPMGSPQTGRIFYQAAYQAFRLLWEIDEQGLKKTYDMDDYDRVSVVHKVAATYQSNTVPESLLKYGYDQIGRKVSEKIQAGTGGEELSTEYGYDTADRIISRKTPGVGASTTVYNTCKKSTTTNADGGTLIEEIYADGKKKATSGSSVPDVTYTYAYESGTGFLKTTELFSSGKTSTKVTDWLGRVVRTETPTFSGATRVATKTYNSLGQLKCESTTVGGVRLILDHIYEYDAFGNLKKEATDGNSDGIVSASTDFDVKEYEFGFQTGVATDLANTYSYKGVLIWPYDGTNAATSRYQSKSYEQVTGLSSTTLSHKYVYDFDRNLTESTSMVVTSSAAVNNTVSVSGSSLPAVETFVNGLKTRAQNVQGQVTLFTYDGLGRILASNDPRIGTTTFLYQPGTTFVSSTTTPDSRTNSATYDNMGRASVRVNPAGKKDYFVYDTSGNLTNQWGETVYPVKYDFNDLNQQMGLHTYRTGIWNTASLPSGFSGIGDRTTWNYHAATGLLVSKVDANNIATVYEYNNLDLKSKRTDGRGWVTNYVYDTRGLLKTVDYTDIYTTDIGYTYDRVGRLSTITDASGTRSFSYYDQWSDSTYDNELRNKSGKLKAETLPSFLGSHVVNRDYQYSAANRFNGADLEISLDTGSLYKTDYGYDDNLRIATVAYNNLTPFTYSYTTNSNLIDAVTQKTGVSTYTLKRQNGYRADGNVYDTITQSWSSSVVTTSKSKYDAVGFRKFDDIQGSSFMAAIGRASDPGVGSTYTYNDRNELDSSWKLRVEADWTETTQRAGTILGFTYDPIGNRAGSTSSVNSGTFATNALNQYTSGPGIPSSSYDNNGNLTSDGVRTYQYDGENQLIGITQGGSSWTYKYDYMGRRISKSGTGIAEKRFIYDGWNLIGELDGTGTLGRRFVWGTDISYSSQGAGGVGGLLAIDVDGTNRYVALYDSSSNVIGLLNGTGGLVSAYEYDAFGRLLTASGAYAGLNPFRFSTKYADDESGLVYYGLRYYYPTLGRFVNRDPIEESGGLNLYGFCGNNAVNRWDKNGQMWDSVGSILSWLSQNLYAKTGGSDVQKPEDKPAEKPAESKDEKIHLTWFEINEGYRPSATATTAYPDTPTEKKSSTATEAAPVGKDQIKKASTDDTAKNVVEAQKDGSTAAPNSSATQTFDDRFKSATGGLTLQDSINLYQKQTGKTLTADQVQKMFTDSAYAKSVLMADKSLHQVYRDILNTNIPGTQADAIKAGFEKLPWYQSIFHNPWYNPWQNSKYIAPDGHREAVYDRNGNPVTGNDYKGTFNFFGPSQAGDHKAADVDPYFKWGN